LVIFFCSNDRILFTEEMTLLPQYNVLLIQSQQTRIVEVTIHLLQQQKELR